MWASYQDHAYWPGLVVGFIKSGIKIQFFPQDVYTSHYVLVEQKRVKPLKSMTIEAIQINVRDHPVSGVDFAQLNAAISVMQNFVDVAMY